MADSVPVTGKNNQSQYGEYIQRGSAPHILTQNDVAYANTFVFCRLRKKQEPQRAAE